MEKTRSWKESSEDGKNRVKLERLERSSKVSPELQPVLSIFGANFQTPFFPISYRTFQLIVFPTALSNYKYPMKSVSLIGLKTVIPKTIIDYDNRADKIKYVPKDWTTSPRDLMGSADNLDSVSMRDLLRIMIHYRLL